MKWTDREQKLLPEFDRALALRDNGELQTAYQMLSALIAVLDANDRRLLLNAHLQCGYISKLLHDEPSREAHFRQAVSVAPASELASLSLFHTLTSSNRENEALLEMVRFVSIKFSEEYYELLVEGYEDNLPPSERSLVQEARRLLAKQMTKN